MYSGRLGNVRKQEDSHRKFMCVMNEMARNRHDLTKNYIKKELHYNSLQQDKSAVLVKREMAQRKILLKCMEMRREDTIDSENNNLFGHYGGRPMQAFTKDIDVYLEETSPRRQKEKMIGTIMKTSRETGMVLGSAKMKEKVRGYLTEKWGVKYPEQTQTNPQKGKQRAEKVDKKVDDNAPTITISALFKPNIQTTKRGRGEDSIFNHDSLSQMDSVSVEEARRTLYPGDDRHKNCKRCFHVQKGSSISRIQRSPRTAEPKLVLERSLFVLPDVHRKKALTHR